MTYTCCEVDLIWEKLVAKSEVKMAKKHNSPQKSKEGRKLKATKTRHDIHEDSGSAQPPILVLRKTDNPERRQPVENGRPEYQLGPVFVPNKLMNGAHSCTSVTRTRSYTERPPNAARINAPSLTGLLKRESSEACRTSRAEISSQFPKSTEKKYLSKLPREDELKRFQKESFLPKIDRPSKTNLSLHSVSSFQQVQKRSPSDTETFKLPPAKSQPGQMVCKKIPSAEKKSPSSDSSASPPKEIFTPKPPSLPKTKSSRNHLRRTREKAT